MSVRNRYPFRACQLQELQHQALIFKYMVSGVQVPVDLLLTLKSSFESSSSSSHFPHQHHPIGLGTYHGRKADSEPGRCRRTDGKKWRCSKEAYHNSKYCERHMQIGRNRSRKPMELSITTSLTNRASPYTSSITTIYPNSRNPHPTLFYPHSSSSSPLNSCLLPPQISTAHQLFFNFQSSYTHTDKHCRYLQGMRNGDGERSPKVPETLRSHEESYPPLAMGSSQLSFQSCTNPSKSKEQQKLEEEDLQQHYIFWGNNFKPTKTIKMDGGEKNQKPFHHFFGDWPPKREDTWLDNDHEDNQSNRAPSSNTELSISMPLSHSYQRHS